MSMYEGDKNSVCMINKILVPFSLSNPKSDKKNNYVKESVDPLCFRQQCIILGARASVMFAHMTINNNFHEQLTMVCPQVGGLL